MNLDRVAAVIRPRSYPESVDLGFRMLRAWWRPVTGAWAVVGLPLCAVLAAACHRWPGVALVLLWWMKPLFARVPVFVLSRALFGALPSVGETLREWPRQLGPGLVASLTWLRFDPIRSLRTPVSQLEGLRGVATRRRLKVLARDVRIYAAILTVTCVLFELCLFVGLLALTLVLDPGSGLLDSLTDESLSLSLAHEWVLVTCYGIAMAFIEPFHAAGGFGLYVNRRTVLEGWDIEVVFRRMRSRLGADHRPAPARATARWARVVMVVVALGGSGAGYALEEGEAVDPMLDPATIIGEVLSDPIFGTEIKETRWMFREQPPSQARPAAFGDLAEMLAAALRAAAWVATGLGLAWGTYHLVRRARISRRSTNPPPALPTELLGMDVRQSSLPLDVPGRALELWEEGRPREALALLYRGALSRLITVEGVALKDSATEGDCIRISRRSLSPERWDYFRALTESWQLVAYGHREPPGDRGPVLIREWNAHFGRPA